MNWCRLQEYSDVLDEAMYIYVRCERFQTRVGKL
jgi:hypothetical protein